MKFNYQKEVDALRTYAILPVLLYHLSDTIIPSGFLGVDLFFVISGFVITKTLIKEKNISGNINIINFFLRRIKRIYPALILMLISSAVFISIFGILNLNNFHFYLKTAIFAIFGVSNIFLIYKSDNYFLNEENNPFVHTWSLGVEEQFYFFYPFILFCVYKTSLLKNFNKNIIILLLIIIFLSLYFFLSNKLYLSNFYSPLVRFWELSFGCLAFIIYNSNKKIFFPFYNLIYILILLLIFFSNSSWLIYEIKTLIIIISTFLFLIQNINNSEPFLKIFFKNKFLIYIGKISYSLYLWHLPLIYLCSIYFSGLEFIILSIVLTFAFASFSYEYVETPFRNIKRYNVHLISIIKSFPIIIIFIFSTIYFYGFNNSKKIINDNVDNLFSKVQDKNYVKKKFDLGERVATNYFLDGNEISDKCFLSNKILMDDSQFVLDECFKKYNKKKLFIINGDCHAQHFIPMIDGSSVIKNVLFLGDISLSTLSENCLNKNSCDKYEKIRKKNHDISIKKINNITKNFDEVIIVNKIFLTEKNENMKLDNYKLVFENFLNKFDPKIKFVFIEPTPTFDYGPEPCVILNRNCEIKKNIGTKYQKKISDIYYKLEQERNNVFLFEANKFLCKKNSCLIYDKNKDFLYFRDNDNLSFEASRYLTKFFDSWILKNLN